MKSKFGHLYFTLGCLLVCNPVVSLFDIFPDFIGCILIAVSLSELKYLDYRFELAVKQLWLLGGVSVIRTALMMFYFDMDASSVLASTSLLGAAECFFFIYFAISLFGGFGYLADRLESDRIIKKLSGIKVVTVVFIAVRVACTVLPELAAILELDLQADLNPDLDLTLYALARYKRYAYVLCFTVAVAMAIYWMREIIAFVKTYKADSAFYSAIAKRYGEFEERNPLVPVLTTLKRHCALLIVGCAFTANLIFDGILLVPAWVGCIILGLSVYKQTAKGLLPYLGCAATLAICAYVPFVRDVEMVCSTLFAVCVIYAVTGAEKSLAALAVDSADTDIGSALTVPRVFMIIYAAVVAVGGIFTNEWIHTVGVLAFALWILLEIKLIFAIIDEMKAKTRL